MRHLHPAGLRRAHEVHAEQEAPDGALGTRRRRHHLDHEELALGASIVPVGLHPVDRVALGRPIDLVEVAELGAGASPAVLAVAEGPPAPPILGPGQGSRRDGAHPLVDRREGRQRLGLVDQAHPPFRLPRPQPGRPPAVDLECAAQRPEAVPEALVDGALRCPQDGDGLAAPAHVIELLAHERAQQALPPMARLHADGGDTGRRHLAARDGEAEREGGGGGDRALAVEGGDEAVRLDGSPPVVELGIREILAEGDDEGGEERAHGLGGGRADRVAGRLFHAAHGATWRRSREGGAAAPANVGAAAGPPARGREGGRGTWPVAGRDERPRPIGPRAP